MPAKRPNPKSKSKIVEEENNLIDREVFDWGVRLTARPFRGTAQDTMTIISEIRNYREQRLRGAYHHAGHNHAETFSADRRAGVAWGLGFHRQGNCGRSTRNADDGQEQEESLSEGSTRPGGNVCPSSAGQAAFIIALVG